ncbi:DUF2865 domain-containing protein [Bosea sp. 117]|uniref:DUF2865 domain-containing protein n=1 Tax=Bosea sp. 117 TaxID=1125973 RepID=UPI000689B950|nr:DUF2865 domain-containing protein [Bosea sp. 117]
MSVPGSRVLVLAGALGAGGVLWAAPAAAENPFVSFLRGDWLRPRIAVPREEMTPPTDAGRPRIVVTPRRGGSGVVYCVRTCDGRYFPLAGAAKEGETAEARCAAFCPASKVKVFTSYDGGSGIDAATSKDGETYAALANAYVFRTETRPNCGCNAAGGVGLTRIDVKDDPTLRPGDVVVTGQGVVVFRGDSRLPHSAGDFVDVGEDRRLPPTLRRQLEAIEIAAQPAGL